MWRLAARSVDAEMAVGRSAGADAAIDADVLPVARPSAALVGPSFGTLALVHTVAETRIAVMAAAKDARRRSDP